MNPNQNQNQKPAASVAPIASGASGTSQPTPSVSVDTLAEAFGQALRGVQPRQKTTYGEVVARREALIPTLPQPTFQNGKPVNPHGLSDDVVAKLATIPSGRYLNGLIEVEREPVSGSLHFRYDNMSTADKRVNFMMAVRSFSDMVNQIHAEAASKRTAR